MAMSNCSKNWDATTFAPADQDTGFKRCCLKSKRFDGSQRDDYF